MRHLLACAAIAATFSFSGAALAQAPSSAKGAPPSATPSGTTPATPASPATRATPPGPDTAPGTGATPATPATPATGANASTTAAGGASLTTGMSVKDNTGAIIGEVKDLKNGLATIQMGSDTFTVEASKLGVTNGVAMINASQGQLKQMLPKK